MADIDNNQKNTVGIENLTTGHNLAINSDGSLSVNAIVSSLPVIPDTSTPITIDKFSDVSSTTGVDTYYVIPSGEVLVTQRLTGGSEEKVGGSVTELFYDPDADLGTNMVRIETIFSGGSTGQVLINSTYTGDGTKRIVLRRRGYTTNAREIWGRWEGYLE